MRAIKSSDGQIVPEQSVLYVANRAGQSWVILNGTEGSDIGTGGCIGGTELKFDESPDELAKLLGWEIVNDHH